MCIFFGIWNNYQVGAWVYIVLSLHTHTHFVHYMSEALYQGLSCLELEGIV